MWLFSYFTQFSGHFRSMSKVSHTVSLGTEDAYVCLKYRHGRFQELV